MADPIDLYFWPTPNGWKASIALEEMGLPYSTHLINIGKGDQFDPAFLRISPNNRMPAIVDPDGPDGAPISVFESGAILMYLARKTGRFYGKTERDRIAVEEWLMWQMGGVGPMAGQAHHFLKYAPQLDPPQDLSLCQRPVPVRGRASIWRIGPSVGRKRVCGGRFLFHRRHIDLGLGQPVGRSAAGSGEQTAFHTLAGNCERPSRGTSRAHATCRPARRSPG